MEEVVLLPLGALAALLVLPLMIWLLVQVWHGRHSC
jgi:hypothetical protein